jgi:hypothetical protein
LIRTGSPALFEAPLCASKGAFSRPGAQHLPYRQQSIARFEPFFTRKGSSERSM